MNKLVEEIIKPILEANKIKKVIGIYGGRFQPFGPHHLKTYKWLESKVDEKCQKGYKTHPTRKTKKMFGKTYRNCVKAEEKLTEGKVDKSFNKIIGLLRKESRKLNDDDSYELSTKLKAWFNKNIM